MEKLQKEKWSVEDLSDKCETLMEYSAQNYIRDETVQLQAQYTQLLSRLQCLVSKGEKQLSDVNEYNTAKKEMEAWLDRAKGTVDDCSSCVGSEADVQDRLDTLRVRPEFLSTQGIIHFLPSDRLEFQILSTKLTEGQFLLNNVLETLNRATIAACPDSEALMRQEIDELRVGLDHVKKSLPEAIAQLKVCIADPGS